MNDHNDMLLIQLDRPRELRFTNKALMEYSALTNTNMRTMEETLFEPKNQLSALFIMLKQDAVAHQEAPPTQDQVLEWLDTYHIKPGKLFFLVNRAMELAFTDEEIDAEMAKRADKEGQQDPLAGTGARV